MLNLHLKISTNQRPPFKVTWPQWRLLIGRNFLIADLAYLSNSKTILHLVKFWSRHYFNIFFSENPLPTASPKVLKIFSHWQTRDQSQVVQNDKLSQESVETKIFVGGNGTFSHFFEKKLKKMWKKISKNFFFY